MPAGTYSVTVTDANGCASDPIAVIIEEPDTFVDITGVQTTSGCFDRTMERQLYQLKVVWGITLIYGIMTQTKPVKLQLDSLREAILLLLQMKMDVLKIEHLQFPNLLN